MAGPFVTAVETGVAGLDAINKTVRTLAYDRESFLAHFANVDETKRNLVYVLSFVVDIKNDTKLITYGDNITGLKFIEHEHFWHGYYQELLDKFTVETGIKFLN